MNWKIYYDDGETHSQANWLPHGAPTAGVICIVGYTPENTRYILHGWDHYRYDEATKQWWGMDVFGVFDRLRHNKPIYAYKEGRTVSKTLFDEIMHKAHNDPYFPQK